MSLVSNANQHVWYILTGQATPCWSWRIDPSVSGKKKKKKSPDLIRKKQMKLYLKQVKWSHPGSTHVFLFLLQTKLIIEHHFGSSFGCLCAHGRDSFSPTWISWRAWTSRRFFQASTGCPPSSGFFQVGRIAYSYNLQPGSVETYFYNLYYFI